MGPRAGQKVFTLQAVPAEPPEEPTKGVAQAAGFSLHAGIGIEADARGKLERLCRYVSRPAVAEERLARTERGDVRVQLKTAYRDGTTHVILDPLDFLARLAALMPPPRVHATRYHGVFAPHHALRAAITPAGRGRGAQHSDAAERAVPKHLAMSWMQRLKRVFAIEIETCRRCGGKLKVIASIEDPALIEPILAHPRAAHRERAAALAVRFTCTAATVAAPLISNRRLPCPRHRPNSAPATLRSATEHDRISGRVSEEWRHHRPARGSRTVAALDPRLAANHTVTGGV